MKLKYKASLSAIALFLAATPGFSQAGVLRCDNCSYFDAESRALSVGYGEHLVLDFQDGDIWRFSVSADPESRRVYGQPIPVMAVETGVDARMQLEFDEVAKLWRDNGGSLKFDYDVRPGDPLYPTAAFTGFTARDVSWSGQLRVSVGRTIATTDFTGEAGRVVSALHSLALTVAQVVTGQGLLRVRVYFPDGSSLVMVMDANHTTEAYYELGSARDSEGNLIPDSSHIEGQPNHPALIGYYNFNENQNFLNWIERARNLGIPIIDGRQGSEPRPIIVECVTTPEGRMRCTARYASR